MPSVSLPGLRRPFCPVLRSDQPPASSQKHRVCHRRQRLHVGRQDEASKWNPSEGPACSASRRRVVVLRNVSNPTFLSQTVEAMQAILNDMTIDDHFSIIDFNHNVRCWSEELVPGSSIQVAEAKKYIQNIRPNGGVTLRSLRTVSERRETPRLVNDCTSLTFDPRYQHQRGPDESHPDAGEGVQSGADRLSLRLHGHPGVRWRPHCG